MVLGIDMRGSKPLNGNLHDIQGQFKEEILSLKGNMKTLESKVKNVGKVDTLVTTLGTHAGKEIHNLRKTIIQEFEMIKEIIFKFKLL